MFEPPPDKNGQRRYGQWAGRPEGRAENMTLCRAEVPDGGRSCLFHQCNRKRGHGPEGAYCKQHAAKAQ